MDSVTDWHQREENFARNMRFERERREISQTDIAKRLASAGWSGFHQTTVSRIEKGERPVRLGEAEAIADILGVGLDRLMATPESSERFAELSLALKMAEASRSAAADAVGQLSDTRALLARAVESGREWLPGVTDPQERAALVTLIERAEAQLPLMDLAAVQSDG